MKTDKLEILGYRNTYVVANRAGEYKHRTHIKKRKTCELLIRLINKKEVPRSEYLRNSAKRITLDDRYIDKINIKIEKDQQKPKYYNKGGQA